MTSANIALFSTPVFHVCTGLRSVIQSILLLIVPSRHTLKKTLQNNNAAVVSSNSFCTLRKSQRMQENLHGFNFNGSSLLNSVSLICYSMPSRESTKATLMRNYSNSLQINLSGFNSSDIFSLKCTYYSVIFYIVRS